MSTVLKRFGGSGQVTLYWFQWVVLCLSLFSIMLSVSLSCIIFIILRFVPYTPTFSMFFYHERFSVLLNAFSISIDIIRQFWSLSTLCIIHVNQNYTSVVLLLLSLYVFWEHEVLVLEGLQAEKEHKVSIWRYAWMYGNHRGMLGFGVSTIKASAGTFEQEVVLGVWGRQWQLHS